MREIISIKNLSFKKIIAYPNISISENKFTFLTGQSGCGKSTLLKLLNLTALPSEGEIFYKDKNIREGDVIDYRKDVLLVGQDAFLFDDDVASNFNLFYDARGEAHIGEEKMKEMLEICCFGLPLNSSCTKLSGGERHRVFSAICLSFMPKVLLLDEPTAALDEKTAIEFLSRIKEFCKKMGISAVVVCHNKGLVNRFADAIIELKNKNKEK